jgi:hypothetical protein
MLFLPPTLLRVNDGHNCACEKCRVKIHLEHGDLGPRILGSNLQHAKSLQTWGWSVLTSWTHMAPILCPARTASSTDLPETSAPRKPPAKASPAPLVSTICWSSRRSTGKIFGLSGSAAETTIVDSEPWVMMTVRERDGFDFGSSAIDLAVAEMSSLLGKPAALAQAAASLSLPITKSQ